MTSSLRTSMLTDRRGAWLWTALVAGSGACADASERYRDFSRRAAEVGFEAGHPDAGDGCMPPAPGAIAGPALLAVENSFGPGLPILYFGDIQTPEIDGKTHVAFAFRALDASDRRTPVGDEIHVGPFPIADDGSFVAHVPSQTLPGSANPILPGVPITSELRLSAALCGVRRFYCGAVTGHTTSPLQGDVQGQFGLSVLDPGEAIPERPRFGCDTDDLAKPL